VTDHFVPTNVRNPRTTFDVMGIIIRSADSNDLKHIVHHRIAMFEEMGFRDPSVLNQVEESSREYFTQALNNGSYLAWLAKETDGGVVGGGGMVIASWPGYPGESLAKRAWILNMYTEPKARHGGVARKLLNVILGWCRANGFRTVSLHASPAGRPLYESAGFQPTNEMRLTL
jgi:GNAT superfamily N-acetyltransferase